MDRSANMELSILLVGKCGEYSGAFGCFQSSPGELEKFLSSIDLRNCTIMFLSDGYYNKNGHERKADSRRAVSLISGGKRIFNDQRNPPMESNLWVGIVYAIGIPTYLLGIVMNWSTWKADTLFLFAAVFSGLRIYYYIRKQNQSIRMRDMELEEKKRRMDDEIFS